MGQRENKGREVRQTQGQALCTPCTLWAPGSELSHTQRGKGYGFHKKITAIPGVGRPVVPEKHSFAGVGMAMCPVATTKSQDIGATRDCRDNQVDHHPRELRTLGPREVEGPDDIMQSRKHLVPFRTSSVHRPVQ